MRKVFVAVALLIVVGFGVGRQFRPVGCKPCEVKSGEAVSASLLPTGAIGSLLTGPTACSWGNKDFSGGETTKIRNGLHYRAMGIYGPCKTAGDSPCTGVIVKMLGKWNPNASPPGWEVQYLTCTAVSVPCGGELQIDGDGYFEYADETAVANYGHGDYFMAVDLYRGSCSPLGSHVFGLTSGTYTL